ncbi:MAG: hypothetical protein Q8P75_03125 [bacterium]|nr:hypothetical protein [bacterium]MDZ4343055.1 hypothetical protein [Candidatus Binatia bacterium]
MLKQILENKKIAIGVVIVLVAAGVFYFLELRPKPLGWQPKEVTLYDTPPPEVLKTEGQIDFGEELPDGFPADMPIDSNSTLILQSYTLVSQNPPPKDFDQATYSYQTLRNPETIFGEFKKYVLEQGFVIDFEAVEGRSSSLLARKNGSETINVTVYSENETQTTVTVSVFKKQTLAQ